MDEKEDYLNPLKSETLIFVLGADDYYSTVQKSTVDGRGQNGVEDVFTREKNKQSVHRKKRPVSGHVHFS